MASPYLLQASDGTDPGVHFANLQREIAVARSGDRRLADRTLWTGTLGLSSAAYPTYQDITFPTRTGSVRFVTAGSASSLQSAINAAAASGLGDWVIVPSGTGNKITTTGITIPVHTGGEQTPGAGNNVVVIMSQAVYDSIDAFTGKPTVLPEGVRVVGASQATRLNLTATSSASFAHIQGSGTGPVFDWANNASHGWRFVGLEVSSDPTILNNDGLSGHTAPVSRIFRAGDGNIAQDTDAEVPKNVWLDRCYVHGHPLQHMLHAVDFQVGKSGMLDCDTSEVHEKWNGDCQAMVCYNSNGSLTFINCYFEASDESAGVGGSWNNVGSLANIELRWCVFGKQDKWNPHHPDFDNAPNASATAWSSATTYTLGQRVSYGSSPLRTYTCIRDATLLDHSPNINHLPTDTGWWSAETGWSVKLSSEIKCGQNVLYAGCLFIGNWEDGQNGDGLNVKHNYQEYVGVNRTQDIIIRDCWFEKLGTAIRIAGCADGSGEPLSAIHRTAVYNCLGTEIGGGYYDANNNFGRWMQTQGTEGLWVSHCTAFATNLLHYILEGAPGADGSDGLTNGYTHYDCVYGGPMGFAYFRGGGTGDGKASIDTWAPGGKLHNNVIAGANSADYGGSDLSGNFFPANTAAIQFTNYNGTSTGDYSLLGTNQTAVTSNAPLLRGSRAMMAFAR